MEIIVLDGLTLNPGDLSWSLLEQLGDVTVYDRTEPEQVVARVQEADIVLTNKTPLSAEIINRLPRLRYIGVLATGYNIVNIQAAAAKGIPVTNVPSYGTSSVAQFVFALLLELCHQIGIHNTAVHQGEWTRSAHFSFTKAPLLELQGKTMGLIGLGRIGRQTARIANAFGMNVLASGSGRSAPKQEEGVQWTELETLLRDSDVVSLHCPLTSETENLINEQRIALMKPTAFLINTARGQIIQEQHLADALNQGLLAGAALDVLSAEPPNADNPLLSASNCVITPHIAWATKEARSSLLDIAVDNLKSYLSGQPKNVLTVN